MKQITVSIKEETHSDAIKYGINLSKTARLAIEDLVRRVKGIPKDTHEIGDVPK